MAIKYDSILDKERESDIGAGPPATHAASHTDGTDDIQDATNAVKGVATAAQITALEANTTHAGSVGSDHSYVDMTGTLDEDNMASDSDTKWATQQSIKAYVDATAVGLLDYKGGYNATNTPDLDTSPSGVLQGDAYSVTAAGTFFTTAVEVGDFLIAKQDAATLESHWDILNKNLDGVVIDTRSLTAGDGISGGGDLSADRTFDLDIDGITTETSSLSTHIFAVYDTGGGELQKVTIANLESSLTGKLSDVVDDTTPQLGGDLDTNGNNIVSVNQDIGITPGPTAELILDGLKWPTADGTADYVLKTNGAGQLSFVAQTAGGLANVVEDTTPQLGGSLDVNSNALVSTSNGDIALTPNGTGAIVANNQMYSPIFALSDTATVAIDCSESNVFSLSLGGSRTLGSPTNIKAGASYTFIITQTTGSHTLAYDSAFKFPGGVAPVLSTGAGDVDILTCVSDGTNIYAVMNKDFS